MSDKVRDKGLIRISQMAKLHGISRQTLILYDKNGLLKPAYVSESGYRYYSIDQIPRLREICLLKEMGVSLAEIATLMEGRSASTFLSALDRRERDIEAQIDALVRQRDDVRRFKRHFSHIPLKQCAVNIPFVEPLGERRLIAAPWPDGPMDADKLHLALMEAWGSLFGRGMIPSDGFGSLLSVDAVCAGEPERGAVSFVSVPSDEIPPDARILSDSADAFVGNSEVDNAGFDAGSGTEAGDKTVPRTDAEPASGTNEIVLQSGFYVCMYKFAMPYEPDPARRVLAWMEERGLVPDEHVVDQCLLDRNFYNDEMREDFCRIEIRIADGCMEQVGRCM